MMNLPMDTLRDKLQNHIHGHGEGRTHPVRLDKLQAWANRNLAVDPETVNKAVEQLLGATRIYICRPNSRPVEHHYTPYYHAHYRHDYRILRSK